MHCIGWHDVFPQFFPYDSRSYPWSTCQRVPTSVSNFEGSSSFSSFSFWPYFPFSVFSPSPFGVFVFGLSRWGLRELMNSPTQARHQYSASSLGGLNRLWHCVVVPKFPTYSVWWNTLYHFWSWNYPLVLSRGCISVWWCRWEEWIRLFFEKYLILRLWYW